jgi:enoyl-CoA hydratase/carnithine racemase
MTNQTLDASTALSIGLVEEVFDDASLDPGVSRIVGELLASADSSLRAIKRLCRAPEVGALEQALSTEGAAQLQALQGPDFLLRLEAFTVRAAARTEGT